MKSRRFRVCLTTLFTWLSLSFSQQVLAHGGAHDHDPTVPPMPDAEKKADIQAVAMQSMRDDYMAKIEPIFRRKCFDCHSNRTEYPWYSNIPGVRQWIDSDIREAREHLDMSGGFPFTSKHSIDHDLEEIGEEIDESSMPPKSYVFIHAQAEVSEEEKREILDWVTKSRKALQVSVAVPKH